MELNQSIIRRNKLTGNIILLIQVIRTKTK